MSGSSNRTQSTMQTTNNSPWSAAQPALKTGLADAEALYKAGIGGQPYTGSTVVPFAQQSTRGFDNIEAIAGNAMGTGNPFERAFNTTGNIAQTGYNQHQQTALDNLNRTASGQDVFGTNPEFQNILRQSQDAARDAVNLNASAAGRYGSGAHQGTLAREVGDLTSRMLGNEYTRQLGRMDAANQNLFNAGQTGIGNQLQATSALPGAFESQFAPANAMIGVGSAYEDLAGRTMNDQLRIFNETQNAPWNQIGRLNAAASGLGQYGTSTTTAQVPRQNNTFGNLLGGAIGGYSLLNGFF